MAERITGHTELIGLIATPIRHSMSPTMHNEAFAHLGLDYVYLAFEVGNQELKDVVQGFRAMKLRGYNVSMPNKTEICQYLDKLSPAAQLVGAVNTVVNDDGVLTGHITDGTGYMRALSEAGIDIIGKKMTVLGAGGAATALCVQAALDGVKAISIFNRRDKFFANAEETVAKIRHNTDCEIHLFDLDDHDKLRAEIDSSVILTNATGVGMKPFEGQMLLPDDSFLRPDLIVSDVVYNPRKTHLLEVAEKKGCRTLNGLGARCTSDYDRGQFNTAISAVMEIVNAASKYLNETPAADRVPELDFRVAHDIVAILAPICPHWAEELYHEALHLEGSVYNEPWPEFDPELAKADTVEIAVQVMGKVRGHATIAADATREQTEKAALAAISEQLEGKTVRKVIVVPGKLVNVVAN